MNHVKSLLSLFAVAALCQISTVDSFYITSIAVTGGLATGLALVGGIVLLKSAALIAANGFRGKRSTFEQDEIDKAFAAIAAEEPEQCYRRLICALATGDIPKTDNDVIMKLFETEDVDIDSPAFDFYAAVKVGRKSKSAKACEVRYSCPLTSVQIASLVVD